MLLRRVLVEEREEEKGKIFSQGKKIYGSTLIRNRAKISRAQISSLLLVCFLVPQMETEDRRTRRANYVLRLVALVTTFIAAVVAGAARETEPIATTDRVGVHLKVKAAGTPQFDYFVAVNAIVCFYSAVSIALWVMAKGGTKNLIFVLTIIDMVAVILLFSGLGSASAMAILFRKGISLTSLYPRICNVYDNFCRQIFAAITISTFASIAYLALIFISHLHLHYSSL